MFFPPVALFSGGTLPARNGHSGGCSNEFETGGLDEHIVLNEKSGNNAGV